MSDQGEWVIVRRFADSTTAEMASAFLKDSGIETILQGERSADLLRGATDIELLVSESRLDDAREALEAFDHGTPMDEPPKA